MIDAQELQSGNESDDEEGVNKSIDPHRRKILFLFFISCINACIFFTMCLVHETLSKVLRYLALLYKYSENEVEKK